MNTTMTTGNIQQILRLAEEKDLIPEQATRVIASGALADLFDENADLGNRNEWRKALGLPPHNPPLLSHVRTFAPTDANPTIRYTSHQFDKWFGDVEDGELASELTISNLERKVLDKPIIAALGGEKRVEVTWGDFKAALAEKEAKGDYTPLIGYVEDASGALLAVSGSWDSDGWSVDTHSVAHPLPWFAGHQALSRPSTRA